MSNLATRIREAILRDVTDRHGWRQAWDSFDADIKRDIMCAWLRIIKDEMKKETKT